MGGAGAPIIPHVYAQLASNMLRMLGYNMWQLKRESAMEKQASRDFKQDV